MGKIEPISWTVKQLHNAFYFPLISRFIKYSVYMNLINFFVVYNLMSSSCIPSSFIRAMISALSRLFSMLYL